MSELPGAGAGPPRDGRRLLGRSGEAAAAEWYARQGYEILARNWRCRDGELDLIVAKARQIVFCEVKTRTSDAFGMPAESVTRSKQMRIRRLAARWLEDAPTRPRAIRFDVASVMDGRVDVVEGAF
ncbi:MAG TPA: YraN family protein [Acidimicrobiales bacterium]